MLLPGGSVRVWKKYTYVKTIYLFLNEYIKHIWIYFVKHKDKNEENGKSLKILAMSISDKIFIQKI